MTRLPLSLLALLLGLSTGAAQAAGNFTVQSTQVADEKPVFATVESRNVVPARTRIGGTVEQLVVKQGDHVSKGQVIAVVTDPKLALQIQTLDAEIAGAQSLLAQTQTDLGRAQILAKTGAGSIATRDAATTAARVAQSTLATRISQRDVARQQLAESEVLAPTDGRVLEVPAIDGAVVLPGDTLATVAEQNYRLRLSLPERHAQFIKVDDLIRFDGQELGETAPGFGHVTLIYPQIQDGRVRVDATAAGIGDYFVGERIRVWVSAGSRAAIVIPSSDVAERFGLDYVRLQPKDGPPIETPIQRGRPAPSTAMPDGLEILSGLTAGDVLVQP
jgi:RND family efflux transporter MFP subunit